MRALLILSGCLAAPAFAMVPGPPWYPYAATVADLEQLNEVACAKPHNTALEEASIGSSFDDPKQQRLDLVGSVRCSPHAVSDGILWRHVAFCALLADRWSCSDARMVATFWVGGRRSTLDFHTNVLTMQRARAIARDVFGHGAAARSTKSLEGDCELSLNRSSADFGNGGTAERIWLSCGKLRFDIDEHCDADRCTHTWGAFTD